MKNPFILPVSIIIAGLLIAGTIYYFNSGSATPKDAGPSDTTTSDHSPLNARPVTEKDHILGSPNAQIVIIEYSDLECPFCKQFHATLQRIVDEYGKDGTVAWVYRHFPLAQLHSKAPNEALASECAAAQGGNDAFWAFINKVFEVTPSNNNLNPAELPKIAGEIGLDVNAFNSCLANKTYQDVVQADYNDAIQAGGTGTPYSVVISRTGQTTTIEGNQPYLQVKAVIDALLGANS